MNTQVTWSKLTATRIYEVCVVTPADSGCICRVAMDRGCSWSVWSLRDPSKMMHVERGEHDEINTPELAAIKACQVWGVEA